LFGNGPAMADDTLAQRGVSGEYAVIEHEVLARPGHERREFGDQVEGLVEHVGASVRLWSLQPQRDVAIRQQGQAVVCNRRSGAVAQKPLERSAAVRVLRDEIDGGVQVEAVEAGLQGSTVLDWARLWVIAGAPQRAPGCWPTVRRLPIEVS
jgi:hypothetical protein